MLLGELYHETGDGGPLNGKTAGPLTSYHYRSVCFVEKAAASPAYLGRLASHQKRSIHMHATRPAALKAPALSFLFTAVLVMVPFHIFAGAQTAGPGSVPPQPPPKTYTQAQLVAKFNGVVKKQMADSQIVLTSAAKKRLQAMIEKGAANIVRDKTFDKVAEAEDNLSDLIYSLTGSPGHHRKHHFRHHRHGLGTDPETVEPNTVTLKRINQNAMDLCPLFPFC
jgi:hypothetical protein